MAKNTYALFDKPNSKEASSELDELLLRTADGYDDIKRKYPKVGIGDTMTDELIAKRLYRAIHFREAI